MIVEKLSFMDAKKTAKQIEIQSNFDSSYIKYYIHFENTGNPCSLIGSYQSDLLTNCTILCLNGIFFQANETTSQKHNF